MEIEKIGKCISDEDALENFLNKIRQSVYKAWKENYEVDITAEIEKTKNG